MPSFEVGKKVICIKNHSRLKVAKGQIFELIGIKKSSCSCKNLNLDIGFTTDLPMGHCNICDSRYFNHGLTWWFDSRLFAPYDDSISEISAEALIEQMEVSANLYLGTPS